MNRYTASRLRDQDRLLSKQLAQALDEALAEDRLDALINTKIQDELIRREGE